MMIRGIVKNVIEGMIKRFAAAGLIDVADREYFQHYGFTSRPKAGAEIIYIVEGNVIIAIASDDRRYRLSLADGEAALYDCQGQKVHLKAGKEIEISGCDILVASAAVSATITTPLAKIVASTRVELDTPLTQCSGDLTVAGGLSCAGTYGATGGKITTPGDITSTAGNMSDKTRSMAADRQIFDGHDHNDPQGGKVGPPNQGM